MLTVAMYEVILSILSCMPSVPPSPLHLHQGNLELQWILRKLIAVELKIDHFHHLAAQEP